MKVKYLESLMFAVPPQIKADEMRSILKEMRKAGSDSESEFIDRCYKKVYGQECNVV